MTSRRPREPGPRGPDGRSTRPIVVLALAAMLIGCGQATSTGAPGPQDSPGASQPAGPSGPAATPSTGTSAEPPSEPPEPTAVALPSATAAGSPVGAGSVAACRGSDENRDFFASMAAAVGWTVYCPALPDGWFVDDGQYRLAGGGWMRIGYDGPGAAAILLQQGAFCPEADGCVPAGGDVGETAFGDRTGVLVGGGDGSWSIVVDRGATLSWLLTVHGLDESGARSIAADLVPIDH